MNHPDSDTTQTNWSEFGQRNQTERCPITGVSRASGYAQVEYSDAVLLSSHAEIGGQQKSKLGAMFNKFLYQK